MTWTTVELQTVTPLFSGDDPTAQDAESLVRVPSIRGALRYWYRAVAAGHGITDLDRLWAAEEAVFGSTSVPSPIRLRIRSQPDAIGPPEGAGRAPAAPMARTDRSRTGRTWATPDWAIHTVPRTSRLDWDAFHGAQYLLGQGLWKHRSGLQRPYVPVGKKVELDVRFSGDHGTDTQFMLALWAWLTYGGLGARTRRGFGQLRCLGVSGPLPHGWAPANLAQPGPAGWQDLGRCGLPDAIAARAPAAWPPFLRGDAEEGEPLPDFPSLTHHWWEGVLLPETHQDLGAALDAAGREWRTFRANANLHDEPGRTMHSPEWLHVIHGTDDRYPVAALGLPVGYFSPGNSQRGSFKATATPHHGETPLRRASPVWIRPLTFGTGWRIFTHVFWSRLLPDGSTIRISGDTNRDVSVPDNQTAQGLWQAWAEREARLPRNFYGQP
jgi:CRISPR-associated protein Cmr1